MSFLPSIHKLTPKHLKKNAKTSNEIKTPTPLSLSLSPFLSLSQQNPAILVTIFGDFVSPSLVIFLPYSA
jgi:hypothetical protein